MKASNVQLSLARRLDTCADDSFILVRTDLHLEWKYGTKQFLLVVSVLFLLRFPQEPGRYISKHLKSRFSAGAF